MEGRSVLCFCFHRRVWSEHALYFLPCYRQRSQCLGTRFTDIKAGCMASVSPYRLQHGKHWFGAGSKAVSLQQCLHDWSQWFLACFGGSMVLERQQPCSTQEGQTGRSNRKVKQEVSSPVVTKFCDVVTESLLKSQPAIYFFRYSGKSVRQTPYNTSILTKAK